MPVLVGTGLPLALSNESWAHKQAPLAAWLKAATSVSYITTPPALAAGLAAELELLSATCTPPPRARATRSLKKFHGSITKIAEQHSAPMLPREASTWLERLRSRRLRVLGRGRGFSRRRQSCGCCVADVTCSRTARTLRCSCSLHNGFANPVEFSG